jgi:putative FmdB family regulatory protein
LIEFIVLLILLKKISEKYMPIYEYKCAECGAHLEKMQKVSDAPLTVCENCGGKLEKQWSLSGFQFKGEGWYVTDYAGKKAESGGKSAAGEKSGKSEKSEKSSAAESTAASGDASNTKSDGAASSAKETTAKKD